MDRIKEQPGLLAIGVAAIATAGLLAYKVMTKKGGNAAAKEDARLQSLPEETEAVELENSFFLDPSMSEEESKKAIVQWMNEQVQALLDQHLEGKLQVFDRKLQKMDFLRIMMIIEGRSVVANRQLSQKLEGPRRTILAEKGLSSLDYINQVISDVAELSEVRMGDTADEVCGLLKVGPFVLEGSFDEYIGNDDDVKPSFVRGFLEQYLNHPFKNGVSKERAEALEMYKATLTKAIERLENRDTYGLFDGVMAYLSSFHAICEDIAQTEHGLNAADFLNAIDSHELTGDASVQPIYKRISDAIQAQLEDGEGDAEAQKQADEEAALQRKKTQNEAIMAILAEQEEAKKKAALERQATEAAKTTPQKEEATDAQDAPAKEEARAESPGASASSPVVTEGTVVANQAAKNIETDQSPKGEAAEQNKE